jgi:hypothetical protein
LLLSGGNSKPSLTPGKRAGRNRPPQTAWGLDSQQHPPAYAGSRKPLRGASSAGGFPLPPLAACGLPSDKPSLAPHLLSWPLLLHPQPRGVSIPGCSAAPERPSAAGERGPPGLAGSGPRRGCRVRLCFMVPRGRLPRAGANPARRENLETRVVGSESGLGVSEEQKR